MFELFFPTFVGVLSAFGLERFAQWGYKQLNKRALLKDLCTELKNIKSNLTGKAMLLYPDTWVSAIASGQIGFLKSKKMRMLSELYRVIQGFDYESKRLRDRYEKHESCMPTSKKEKQYLHDVWQEGVAEYKKREEDLGNRIEAVLKELCN